MRVLVQHPRCPYCHDAVDGQARKTACHRCMSWHHDACWDELGRCGACAAEEPLRFTVTAEAPQAACPRCANALAEHEHPVPLLLCSHCWAFWAPAQSLGPLLIGIPGIPQDGVDTGPRLEPNVNCFECAKGCQRAVWGELVLDVCPGHGVWFDAGELVALRRRFDEFPQQGLALLSRIAGTSESDEGPIPSDPAKPPQPGRPRS